MIDLINSRTIETSITSGNVEGAVGSAALETEIQSATIEADLTAPKIEGTISVAKGENGKDFTYEDFTPEQLEALKGEDGVSCYHEWDGTILTITSASGTSSADLKGEKGDDGDPIAGSVLYSEKQTLSATEKETARANIFAANKIHTHEREDVAGVGMDIVVNEIDFSQSAAIGNYDTAKIDAKIEVKDVPNLGMNYLSFSVLDTYKPTGGTASYNGTSIFKLPFAGAFSSNFTKEYDILTSKNPVKVEQGGTGATTAAEARTNLGITLENLNGMSKDGGEMNGELVIPSLRIKSSVDNNMVDITTNDGSEDYYLNFKVWDSNVETSEDYFNLRLEMPRNGYDIYHHTHNYKILTTLEPVSIEEGGTGATTAAGALAALGGVSREELGNFVDLIYPVGSIYMNINLVNPSTLFGGTWVRIKDRFLLAVGNTYGDNKTGGAATDSISLSHKHLAPIAYSSNAQGFTNINGTVAAGNGKAYRTSTSDYSGTLSGNVSVGYTSTETLSATIDTIPPYQTVYIWQRTE